MTVICCSLAFDFLSLTTGYARAAEFGTPDEAKMMLSKASVELKRIKLRPWICLARRGGFQGP